MRALIVAVLLAIAAPAYAQEAAQPAPVEIKPGRAPMPPEPIAIDPDPDVGRKKPSGFWTGYRPARGGAYRWRILGVAMVVLALTIFLVVRMLRRVSRERDATSSKDWSGARP